jgi:1,2-diacylglycerol 3-alpha-glucosyltransferase
MRIAIAGQSYSPAANGQAVFTMRLAEGLAQAGHAVMVIVPSDRLTSYRLVRDHIRLEGLAAIPIGHPPSAAYITGLPYIKIHRLLSEFRPDVVHIQDHYLITRVVLAVARAQHIPVVGTNHFLPDNLLHYVEKLPMSAAMLEKLLWLSMLQVFNNLDAVTTPTETGAEVLRGQRIRPPVQAVSCGVDLSRFKPFQDLDRSSIRRKYRLDTNRRLLLYVGRVDQEKRLDVLLRAMTRLQDYPVQLCLAGAGRQWTAIEALAENLGLLATGKVVLPGLIPPDDLPGVLNSADAFVMPSEAELQSIATLEAMACGLPIVAANAMALPELVADDVNGRLFRPGDPEDLASQVRTLLDGSERLPGLGRASRVRAEQHSLSQTIRQYLSLYSGVRRSRKPVPQHLFGTAKG